MKKAVIPVFTEAESFGKHYYKDFYISSYEDVEEANLNRVEPHRHTYYEVIWIVEGFGSHSVDFRNYPFKGPCLFLLQPGHVHKIIKEVPTRGYILKFSESFFSADGQSGNLLLKYGIFDNINVQPVVSLTPSVVTLLTDLLQKMMAEYEQHAELSKVILASYLKIFLLQVFKLKDSNQEELKEIPEPRYLIFRQFKRLVEDHFASEHAVNFYTSQLSLTGKTLNEITHRYAGKTAGDIIQDRILLEAKRFIYNGELSVKEIAARLGFNDAAYFTRFFTNHQGVSPQQFRKEELSRAAL